MSSTATSTSRFDAVVADSSAVFDLIKNAPAAAALRRRLSDVVLYAPDLIDLEVLQALRRYVLFREMNLNEANAALETYAHLPLMRFAHGPLFHRVWELRANLTSYDAAYVALAEGMTVPLITLDARLARAAPPTVRVELFA